MSDSSEPADGARAVNAERRGARNRMECRRVGVRHRRSGGVVCLVSFYVDLSCCGGGSRRGRRDRSRAPWPRTCNRVTDTFRCHPRLLGLLRRAHLLHFCECLNTEREKRRDNARCAGAKRSSQRLCAGVPCRHGTASTNASDPSRSAHRECDCLRRGSDPRTGCATMDACGVTSSNTPTRPVARWSVSPWRCWWSLSAASWWASSRPRPVMRRARFRSGSRRWAPPSSRASSSTWPRGAPTSAAADAARTHRAPAARPLTPARSVT